MIMKKLSYTPTWWQKELELANETEEFKKLENSLKKKLVLEDELKLIEDDYSAKIS